LVLAVIYRLLTGTKQST